MSRVIGVGVAVLLLVAIASPARASDDLLLAGTSNSTLGDYSYVGALVPLGGGRLGQGWIMRQWLDRVVYRYNGLLPDVRATAYGYAPAVGYQWALDGGTNHMAIYGGVRVVHTRLDPYDPGNANRGTHVRPTLQGELTSNFGVRVQNQLLAEGEFGNGAYFVRDRLLWRIWRSYTLGPEVIAQGSREYQAHAEGLCLGGITLTHRATLLLHAGVYQQRGRATVGTFGVELTATL